MRLLACALALLLAGCSGVAYVGTVEIPGKQVTYYRPYTGIPLVRLHERIDTVVYDKATGATTYHPGAPVSFKSSGLPLVGSTAVGLPCGGAK